jgi:hypothetical protein
MGNHKKIDSDALFFSLRQIVAQSPREASRQSDSHSKGKQEIRRETGGDYEDAPRFVSLIQTKKNSDRIFHKAKKYLFSEEHRSQIADNHTS